jgi:Ca2+-binding EF-hand superfamily protein
VAPFARAAIIALGIIAAPLLAQPRPAAAPAAAPASADVARASFIATMDAQFRSQDPNADGKLTRAEVEANERGKLLAEAQAQNRNLFAQLDADRNGAISGQEFARLVQAPALPDVSATMTRLDSNRDQVVTLVEYRAATLANFDRLDTDHDGVVTALEMRAGGVAPAGR